MQIWRREGTTLNRGVYAGFEKQLARKDVKLEAEEKEKADLEATLEKENAGLEATLEKKKADLEATLEKEILELKLEHKQEIKEIYDLYNEELQEKQHGAVRPDTRTRGGKRRTEGPEGDDGDGGSCGGIRWRSECRGTGLPASKAESSSTVLLSSKCAL